MNKEMITTKQAAKVLGINEQALRERMKAGAYDIGVCWKPKGSKNYVYDIFKSKLEKLIGRTLTDEECREG